MVKKLFNKIKLLSDIADHIAYYGVRCGNPQLMDYIDMNCGAVPEGDVSGIIDEDAPKQFLEMYIQIAENRFAAAVTELLKMNPQFIKPVSDFCVQVGKEMNVPPCSSIEEAFQVIDSFVLDGFSDNKKIISRDDSKIVWEQSADNHESAWKKAGGNLSVYYELQQDFVNGLLSASNISYSVENGKIFTLSEKSVEKNGDVL